MIIVCKNCMASFLVPSNVFAKGAKTFQCAKCGHAWKEHPPVKSSPIKSPQPFSPPPKAHIPPAPVEEKPEPPIPHLFEPEPAQPTDWARIFKLFLFALATAFFLFFLCAFVFLTAHTFIIAKWPQTQPVYVMLGIAKDPLEDNILLTNIHSVRRYTDGAMQLVVEGNVVSHAKKRQVIPEILAKAIGPDGKVIESWRIKPPKATIDPNTTIPFSSAIISPQENATEVSLHFTELAEPKDEH